MTASNWSHDDRLLICNLVDHVKKKLNEPANDDLGASWVLRKWEKRGIQMLTLECSIVAGELHMAHRSGRTL